MFNKKIALLVVFVSAVAAASVVGSGRIPSAPQDEFTVKCPTEAVRSGQPIVFSVDLKTSDPDAFSNWSVNRGRITNGQNSQSITVDTTGIRNQPVTATLEVGARGCRRSVSCTAYVTEER
jgi:hypothetical protein